MSNLKIALIASMFILFSCAREDEIILEIDNEETLLVVNGFINPADGVTINISNSQNQGNPEQIKGIKDAEIKLYENDILIGEVPYYGILHIHDSIPRHYYVNSAINVQVGKEYKIEVTHPDYKEVSAKTTIPSIAIAQPKLKYLGRTGEGEIQFNLTLNENKSAELYYALVLQNIRQFYEVIGNDTIIDYVNVDTIYQGYQLESHGDLVDAGFKAYQSNTGYLSWTFSNINFQKEDNTILVGVYGVGGIFDNPNFGMRNVITAEVRQVSMDYYEYFKTLSIQQEIRDDPFTTEINIYNNIIGGLGNFSGYATVKSNRVNVD